MTGHWALCRAPQTYYRSTVEKIKSPPCCQQEQPPCQGAGRGFESRYRNHRPRFGDFFRATTGSKPALPERAGLPLRITDLAEAL